MIDLIDVGFSTKGSKTYAWSSATSYHLQHAVYTSGKLQKIEYSAVRISNGRLPQAFSPSAAASGPGAIMFSWQDNTGLGIANATDKAILAVYCEALKKCIYTTFGVPRSAGSDWLSVSSFAGQTVHTWLGFVSENGKDVAASVYTGEVKL